MTMGFHLESDESFQIDNISPWIFRSDVAEEPPLNPKDERRRPGYQVSYERTHGPNAPVSNQGSKLSC